MKLSLRKKKQGRPLTPREHEIIALMARGFSNKRIADASDVSEHTAKFHVNNIIAKLGAETRTDAVVKYMVQQAFDRAAAATSHPDCVACKLRRDVAAARVAA